MKKTVSLNGRWRFAPELEYRPTNNHNLTGGNVPLYAMPELCRRDWEYVPVPGVWERYGEKYSIYEGVCWYTRTFNIEEPGEDAHIILRFFGVAYKADIFLNGKKAGEHESGYTEFSMDVTDYVTPGENFLAVMVDNRAQITKWPNDRGYFGYGGIHRDVQLEIYEGSYLENIEVTPYFTKDGGEAVISAKIKGDENTVSVKLGEEEKTVEVKKNENGVFSTCIHFDNIKPWSPDDPVLYPFSVSYAGEAYASFPIGFRAFTRKNGELYLNDKPFYINGACYVYDSPKDGLVMSEEQLSFDLAEMKEAGVNFIRTHYPMDDKFYTLCDRLGFLVWIEPNIYCSKPDNTETDTVFKRPEYVSVAESMTREMIAAARHHASVSVYGIGNECNVSHPEAKVFFKNLAALVRETDATRLVAFAALGTNIGNLPEIVDLLGFNGYYGWYGKINDLSRFCATKETADGVELEKADASGLHYYADEVLKNTPCDIPVILTEFGADSIPGLHSSAHDLWSEEYHADIIEAVIREARTIKRIKGTCVFAFTDYIDPCKPMNGYWKEHNLKGMLSYMRDRKAPFYAMRKMYKGEK